MSTQNKSSFLRTLAISLTTFGCAAGLLFSSSVSVTHAHRVNRSGNKSTDRRHTTTLHASDSPEGSRVVLTADQSLNTYEAYGRGDTFYVKIPFTTVPHVDSVRGHAFTEVKVEQGSDATIVSFRLRPGVTGRAELSGDRLEIVFAVSRARSISSAVSGVIVAGMAIHATAQSRTPSPRPKTTPITQRHVTRLRSTDSPQGSRVTISSDQSLMEYEAYRQGDRFFLRIPASDIPRVEAVRGRGFADVTAQSSRDKTTVAFRLRPGASAHVEQKGNRLDVVITLPPGSAPVAPLDGRAGASSARPIGTQAPRSSRAQETLRASNPAIVSASPNPEVIAAQTSQNSMPAATSSPTPGNVANQTASPSPTAAAANQARGLPPAQTGTTFRQRVRYWVLLAQLNPIPVAIGAAVLLLLIALLVFQRRRAKATRRVRGRISMKQVAQPIAAKTSAAASRSAKPAMASAVSADAATTTAAASVESSVSQADLPVLSERQERVANVSEEVKKLMAGGDYNESIVASDDRDTRKLVGAELLSALVGRNMQRRERARAAFMKHGYFDDATRDLRVAESPNERAAAARRLSFVHDREATAHLVAALDDSSPDVRRAVVEALLDLRDPAAIAPLNSLMQTENDRKVPRNLIKHAIDACASGTSDESITVPAASSLPQPSSNKMPPQPEIEREVIEI